MQPITAITEALFLTGCAVGAVWFALRDELNRRTHK